MNAEALEQTFEADEDVLAYFDLSTLRRPGLASEPVEINFPQWMVAALDHEAQRLGVPRDAVIKLWLAERLQAIAAEP